AATEGYSRQRPLLATAPSLHTPYGSLGTGVFVADVSRLHDAFADVAFRRNTASTSDARTRHDVLERIEQLYGEPSGTGLAATLDAFWSAWSDLATMPDGIAERSAVRYRGEAVALHLNRLASAAVHLRLDPENRRGDTVARINELTRQIAGLNRDILAAEAAGGTASDLRDARGRALDSLAELADIQVFEHDRGEVTVIIDNATVVDGPHSRALEVRT